MLQKAASIDADAPSFEGDSLAAPGPGGDAVDVRDHVHDGGFTRGSRACSRAPWISPGWSTRMPKQPMASATLAKSMSSSFHSASEPSGLAAVQTLVAVLLLVQRMVVVDDGDGVDAVPQGGLHLPQVIPESRRRR